jgi:hypothetical protein
MGCQGGTVDQQPASEIAQEFSLKGGQTTVLESEQLTIRFKSVTNESRCPVNLRCVWEGNAQVNLQVTKAGKSPSKIALNTLGMRKYPREAKYLDYTIKLVARGCQIICVTDVQTGTRSPNRMTN